MPDAIRVPKLKESGVLISGGTSGVGLATAFRFADAGVERIALIGRNLQRGEEARRRLLLRYPKIRIAFIGADANKVVEVLRAVDEATAALDGVDVLVNTTVGPFIPKLFHETNIEEIEQIVVQQMLAPLLMCRAVLADMRARRGGVIINIASDAGKVATPGESVIGAAMAAIIMFSKGLAIEAKRSGIRVNTLTPSLIEGTLTHERVMADPFSARLFGKAASLANLGVAQPDDLAGLVVFLASPQGARITGQTVSVNGGISVA
jgi:NAD(P)-dependent dehydrogenase (short-subunit alcohol dehydrogenase family)